MSKILDTALGAFGIVLVIDDVEAFFGEEPLLDRDPPGTVMAKLPDGFRNQLPRE